MEFKLDLRRHCIETELKRCSHRLLSTCLKDPAAAEAWAKTVESLEHVLRNADFARLRTDHPRLSGGHNAAAVLSERDSRWVVCLEGEEIALT